MTEQKWPDEILLIRHGESRANVRKAEAKADGELYWNAGVRDQDVPLTEKGEQQALHVGKFLAGEFPKLDTVIFSPYLRTRQTAAKVVEGMGYSPEMQVEERIREIEFGNLDGLTKEGVKQLRPDEHARREREGKYWFRPPGGESRPDVRLRVGFHLGTISREYAKKRILISAHSVVVLAYRSLLERWTEDQYMQVDRENDVLNCGITRYVYSDFANKLILADYNRIVFPEELR